MYRSTDYGGTWQRVTMSYDDPRSGLKNSDTIGAMAVSGVSGEIAVASNGDGGTEYSLDYGLTWNRIGGDQLDQSNFPPRLWWVNSGSTDVLLAAEKQQDGSWEVWRADMSSASPTLVKETSDPFGTDSAIDVAATTNGGVIGRVDSSGNLSFAALTAASPISFGPTDVSGLPAPAIFFRLGGAQEASSPPDGVLVVGANAPNDAVMLTKSAGSNSFAGASESAATPLPASCELAAENGNGNRGASVSPDTTGTTGEGNAGDCWLQKNGSGALTLTPAIGEGKALAYDADYGHGNLVILNAQTSSGPQKYAAEDGNGVPTTTGAIAQPGADPSSGGHAITGINTPDVRHTIYGPDGASEIAVAARHEDFASKDGGRTMTQVVPFGGRVAMSAAWWQGATAQWLMFGQGFDCNENMLTALPNWDGSSTVAQPNVQGSSCSDFGGPPEGYWGTGGYTVNSVVPVPGTDTFFMGLGVIGTVNKYGTPNRIYRGTLSTTGPTMTALTNIDSSATDSNLYLPTSMAYCSSSSAATSLQDVLLVATAQNAPQGNSGSLLRITGATTGSPTVTAIASVPNTALNAVRADCGTGDVYAGGSPSNNQSLYKSTDGGQTFQPITVPGPGNQVSIGAITAIGLDPSTPNTVEVAANQDGLMAKSTDGGSTWTFINDPTTGRPAYVADIEFPSGGTGGARHEAAAASDEALIGTGSGAYLANLSLKTGIVGASKLSTAFVGRQVTTLASDVHPAIAYSSSTGVHAMVFSRRNGLYWTNGRDGEWSIPLKIPGTSGPDDFPSLTALSDGSFALAFARSGGGIYVSKESSGGSWSAPQQVTSLSGATLPSLTANGSSLDVAFLCTSGDPGVWSATNASGSWAASKISGTDANDADTTRGAPSLAVDGGSLHLAFARAGVNPGIYYTTDSSGSWSTPTQLTSGPADRSVSLAVDSAGTSHIVLASPLNPDPGLYELTGTSTFTATKVAGTGVSDENPSLTLAGSTLALSFTRTSGSDGVYEDSRDVSGSWQSSPTRVTGNPFDLDPQIAWIDNAGPQIVFARQTSAPAEPKTLAVAEAGTGSGAVTSSPAGLSCGSQCAADFAAGTAVTLTATAAPGSSFQGWSGDCSGTGSCTVAMDTYRSVTATFTSKTACVVPRVIDLRLQAAKHRIAAAHCSVGKIRHARSKRVKRGRIVSQSPRPGKRLVKGAPVNLVVSKGRH